MRVEIDEERRLSVRSAAIFLWQSRVLLHRAETDDFWTLPGGGSDFFESSEETIIREMSEEIGASVKPIRLCWVVENFFNWQEKKNHEIGFYQLAKFQGLSKDLYSVEQFEGQEKAISTGKSLALFFKWFELSALPDIDLRPSFLIEGLSNIPSQPIHIVHSD